jgi:hypothetical protein
MGDSALMMGINCAYVGSGGNFNPGCICLLLRVNMHLRGAFSHEILSNEALKGLTA